MWCFRDTPLVEVKTLFNEIKRGTAIDYYVKLYPKVTPRQVSKVLEFVQNNARQPAKQFFKMACPRFLIHSL